MNEVKSRHISYLTPLGTRALGTLASTKHDADVGGIPGNTVIWNERTVLPGIRIDMECVSVVWWWYGRVAEVDACDGLVVE